MTIRVAKTTVSALVVMVMLAGLWSGAAAQGKPAQGEPIPIGFSVAQTSNVALLARSR